MKRFFATLMILTAAAPAVHAMDSKQEIMAQEIPVRAVSAGIALCGIATLLGSSKTKLRAALRISVGTLLTVGGILGTLYGDAAPEVGSALAQAISKDVVGGIGKGFSLLCDGAHKLYYGIKREFTDDYQDHGRFFLYSAKDQFNRYMINRKPLSL